MKAKDIVSCVMKMRGHSCRSLSEKLKYPHPSGVSQRLRGNGDMNVAVLIKFLEAMDCELVIRSTLADKSEWVVTCDDTNGNRPPFMTEDGKIKLTEV